MSFINAHPVLLPVRSIGFRLLSIAVLLSLLLSACGEPDYTPKPRAFPRIDFPQATTTARFDRDFCTFSFDYPAYADVRKDQTVFDEDALSDCWFDLHYPTLNASIYFSYVPVGEQPLEKLKQDAFKMTDWHTKKATYIDEIPFERDGIRGILFRVEGPAASPYQFYVTDTLGQHFLRGALYVESKIQPDSLAPVYQFMKRDMDQVLATFAWND